MLKIKLAELLPKVEETYTIARNDIFDRRVKRRVKSKIFKT